MTPCQKLLKQEGTARRIESMQQSSATPSLHLWFLGVAEDCCMLSILLAVPSCFNSFWHGVIPTSYFIFTLVYIGMMQVVLHHSGPIHLENPCVCGNMHSTWNLYIFTKRYLWSKYGGPFLSIFNLCMDRVKSINPTISAY